MKKLAKAFAVIAAFSLLLLVIFVQKIDRTPLEETSHYREWQSWIDKKTFAAVHGPISVGWAQINITPSKSLPMAGYGNRWGKPFERVRDSLYVRAISLINSGQSLTLVSADLLIIPPNVTERLLELLSEEGIDADEIHLGATHTHHSTGGWGRKLAGRLFAGKFDPEVEEMLALRLRDVILASRAEPVRASVDYLETDFEEGIRNRLDVSDPLVDSEIRSLRFRREDGRSAVLLVYGAHPTTLRRDSLYLSRDYPGHTVDAIEQDKHTDFALFMAGAVGSMGFQTDADTPDARAVQLGERLAGVFLDADSNQVADARLPGDSLRAVHSLSEWVPIPLPPQTARISRDFALRPWVFSAFFGQSPGAVKVTLIDQTLLLGMPADFSGEISTELDEYARKRGLNLVITSFNGYYTGYITHDRHYEKDLYETTTMSWNGFGAGDYYTRIARDIIDKIAAL